MLAIQGHYQNGILTLDKEAPLDDARVLVVFPIGENFNKEEQMTTDEALLILDKYAGSIDRDIDYEKERDEYFNEKYGPFN